MLWLFVTVALVHLFSARTQIARLERPHRRFPLAGRFRFRTSASLFVHCQRMKLLKELAINLLILLGLVAFAVVRAMVNILNRRI
jgi:hypothetical protein